MPAGGEWLLLHSVKAACRQARQAEISTGEEAQVDGVAVQADVLQSPADVAVVPAVAERVYVHDLDVVVLGKEIEKRR